jgi:hypothetical protein
VQRVSEQPREHDDLPIDLLTSPTYHVPLRPDAVRRMLRITGRQLAGLFANGLEPPRLPAEEGEPIYRELDVRLWSASDAVRPRVVQAWLKGQQPAEPAPPPARRSGHLGEAKAARHLGISLKRLQRLRRDGLGPPYERTGDDGNPSAWRYSYRTEDLDAWRVEQLSDE